MVVMGRVFGVMDVARMVGSRMPADSGGTGEGRLGYIGRWPGISRTVQRTGEDQRIWEIVGRPRSMAGVRKSRKGRDHVDSLLIVMKIPPTVLIITIRANSPDLGLLEYTILQSQAGNGLGRVPAIVLARHTDASAAFAVLAVAKEEAAMARRSVRL